MATTTLFKIIQTQLINAGKTEFVNEAGELVYFNEEYQFTWKILNYDEDVQNIVDKLFNGVSLNKRENDIHFKKMFLFRFYNRMINKQTIEAFQFELMSTLLSKLSHINRVYDDLNKYLENTQTATSSNNATSDYRQAFSNLPQDSVNIDVDNTVLTYANDNTINRTKNIGNNDSENKSYQLSNLIESSHLFDDILNDFDVKCFSQFW